MNEAQQRFWQTQRLVDKECAYLQDVAQRLFTVPLITREWIEERIAEPGAPHDRCTQIIHRVVAAKATMGL